MKRLASALVAATIGIPAATQAACEDRAMLTHKLKAGMGAKRVMVGLHDSGETLIEIYCAPASGKWVAIRVLSGEIACVIDGGRRCNVAAWGEGT